MACLGRTRQCGVANRQMKQLLLRVAKGDFARLEILRAMATTGSAGGSPQSGLGRVWCHDGRCRTGSAGPAPDIRIGEETGRLVIFTAGLPEWLTAPNRNETPCYRRLTGTKTPVFGA